MALTSEQYYKSPTESIEEYNVRIAALRGESITSDALAPEPSLNFNKPEPENIFPVDSLEFTEPEREAEKTIQETKVLQEQTAGESTFRTQQEEAAGIPELQKTQADLAGQLKILQAQARVIPIQLQKEAEGRGITVGGLRPIETARLRENAIQALTTASLFEASRGNLTTALELVDRSVKQRFDPIKEQIAIKQANLDLILKSPAYSLAEKRRAQAQKDAQERQTKLVDQQEADEKEIKGYVLEAAKRGASAEILQRIQSANSPEEALQLSGFYLGAEFRQEIKDKQFQKDLQTATFNLSLQKFEEDKRQFGITLALKKQEIENERLKELAKRKPVETAEITSEILQNKINLIDNLITHAGLHKSVGPSKFGRIAPFKFSVLSGQAQDFSAGVAQLVNKETIDTLVNLKARGGTLGALSDQERVLLQGAATKIGSWEIRDKQGFGTGRYNTSEKAFLIELNKIRDLAIKAKARALGGGVGIPSVLDEERSALRQTGYSDEQIELLEQIK